MPPGVSLSDFYYILPELVLTAGALLVLIADVLLPRTARVGLAAVTLVALFTGAFLSKIRIEEQFMTAQFGADYARYRNEVPALIPMPRRRGG